MRRLPLFTLLAVPVLSAATATDSTTLPCKQYCFGCHGKAAAMAGINLEALTSRVSVGDDFQKWLKVANVLEQKRMPPPKMKQPSDDERAQAVKWIHAKIGDYTKQHAGD